MSSGTGATGAAVAHVAAWRRLPGHGAISTAGSLTVDVGEDLHVDLAGRAVPVFAAELDQGQSPRWRVSSASVACGVRNSATPSANSADRIPARRVAALGPHCVVGARTQRA